MDPRTNSSNATAEDRRIDAMRQRNEERRKRFLNAKDRSLGVDTEYLARQVAEKKAREDAEKIAAKAYAEEQRQIRLMLEMNILEERAAEAKDRAEVAQTVQVQRDPTLRREWDLNDPKRLKKELPPRVGDNDPRCGPSSLQVFAGEDLRKGDREKMQEMQMRDWCAQSLEAKQSRVEKAAMEDKMYSDNIIAVVNLTQQMEEQERDEKAIENMEYREANLQFAAAKEHQQKLFVESEEARRQASLAYSAKDPFLNEHRTTGISSLGRGRYRPDHWKGMTTKELQNIFETQKRQAMEKEESKNQERARENEYANYKRAVYNMTQEANMAEQFEARADQYAVRAEQAKQIVEKHTRDAFLKKERAGYITDDFFKGFGSSHR